MRNTLVLLFITTVISGCATSSIDSNFKPQEDSETVFVFKINPAKKIVFFFKGKEEDGVFIQDLFSKAIFRGKPNNGYVIFKAKPGETISLTQYAHKSYGYKNTAWPCKDFETISFTVPTSEVLYMADLTLGNKGEAFTLNLDQNFDQAKAHLQQFFPNLAPNIKQGEFKMIKGDRSCAENVVVPVAASKPTAETIAAPVAVDNPTAETIAVPVTADKSAAERQVQIIHSYVAAFNAGDTDAMLEMVTDDVQRLTVDGETATKETNSKEELRSAMLDYFNSCSTCKLRLANTFSLGSKVSASEIESFQTRNGPQQQKGVSLYEFSGSLIDRIYYFPADK